ncbi:hypothetical protein ElyMa_005926700 [Elysia marginata]|uniref:Uncharacterized protein n=1 Tax=Elysia marginata TaxID=1093978 RepID=A0AAV4G7I6_9GAST|nr:hypothetical protein ElyMa_005926700 [Elysia marginata]
MTARKLLLPVLLSVVTLVGYFVMTQNWKPYRVAGVGGKIGVDPTKIHISTAVSYADFPAMDGFNVFLNGWARYEEVIDFKCCLLCAEPGNTLNMDVVTEVKAWLYHQHSKWLVDMQATEFSCSVSRDQLSQLGLDNFTHMTMTRETCLEAPR